MPKPIILATALLAGLAAIPASAAVRISCYRGPIPESSLINGANRTFVQSIYETYDVSADEARAIANSVCSDMRAVDDRQALIELTKQRLAGLHPR